jgi:hypothetical protein
MAEDWGRGTRNKEQGTRNANIEMYQTEFAPTFSLEQAARVMGLAQARRLWDYYALMDKKRDAEAVIAEEIMAREAAKKKYIVNEELGGEVAFRMAPKTYLDLWRSSLPEKGCSGGELLEDENYMRWFLKRNPQCRIASGSGKIVSGWTPEVEAGRRLAEAARRAEVERAGKLIVEG